MPDVVARRLATFDHLTQAEQDVLKQACESRRSFKAGEDIIRARSKVAFSTALQSGWAGRYKVLKDGQRQISAIHLPGDFLDLHAFPLHYLEHGVFAISDCEALLFPHDRLRKITETQPHLTRVLWTVTLVDAAIHREWLVMMGQTGAVSSMAHLICELYTRLEAVSLASNYRFKFPLNQSELGDALGISGVHVNRSAQQLRAQALINWRAGEMEIRNWAGLANLGYFEPEYLHQSQDAR